MKPSKSIINTHTKICEGCGEKIISIEEAICEECKEISRWHEVEPEDMFWCMTCGNNISTYHDAKGIERCAKCHNAVYAQDIKPWT